jgi:hypothetical protein
MCLLVLGELLPHAALVHAAPASPCQSDLLHPPPLLHVAAIQEAPLCPYHHCHFLRAVQLLARVTEPLAAGILEDWWPQELLLPFLLRKKCRRRHERCVVTHHCLRLSDATVVKKYLVHTGAKGRSTPKKRPS